MAEKRDSSDSNETVIEGSKVVTIVRMLFMMALAVMFAALIAVNAVGVAMHPSDSHHIWFVVVYAVLFLLCTALAFPKTSLPLYQKFTVIITPFVPQFGRRATDKTDTPPSPPPGVPPQ